MSPTPLRRFGAAVLAGACLAPIALADGFGPPWSVGPRGGACSACGDSTYKVCRKSNYRPPSVHPCVPFGYYPNAWARWPAPPAPFVSHPITNAQPPIAPEGPTPLPPPRLQQPDAEPLPPPRPADTSRAAPDAPLLELRPAAYPGN